MKFYDMLTGAVIDRLNRSEKYRSECSSHTCCQDCTLPNMSNPWVFAEHGLGAMYCSEFRDNYPELAAPYYQCEVIYEPGDDGYTEESSYIDGAEVFKLLGF